MPPVTITITIIITIVIIIDTQQGLLLSSVLSCLGWLLIFLAAQLQLLAPLYPGVEMCNQNQNSGEIIEILQKTKKSDCASLLRCAIRTKIMGKNNQSNPILI